MDDKSRLLLDVERDIIEAKEEISSLSDFQYTYTDYRAQIALDKLSHLEYIKSLIDNPEVLNCHIQDYNDYNDFKEDSFKANTNGLHFIASDAQIDEVTNGKEMYITTAQLIKKFSLNKSTIKDLRELPYSDPQHLEHYKINSKVIVYKFAYVVQYIEKYNKRFN